NGELQMTGGADRSSYIEVPFKFKLPFRIDMTAKMDSPALILRIGDGYINLNTGGMDNRRMMSIVGGETKPNIHKFDNFVPLNEFFDVTVIYGKKAMQLIINGEERYFNKKDAYMKPPKTPAKKDAYSAFSQSENFDMTDTDFSDGFGIKLACFQRTEVFIKSLAITEYDDEPEFKTLPKRDYVYAPTLTKTEKPQLEDCIKDLSPELINCILDMDKHLKALKFRRLIEGGCTGRMGEQDAKRPTSPESKISYTMPRVTLWKMNISHHLMTHRTMAMLGFYVNQSGKYEEKFNALFLRKLEEYNPDFAGEIFFRMSQMNYCKVCGGSKCSHFNLTEYKGSKKNNCAHFVQYKMIPSDFADVKIVLDIILKLSKELTL
ncbi:MAG: hypothetical protein FWE82_04285, partial [Defluviitaleaceae bacterium]|nr:hypothetical protein [Defluviitaleaceae bacterium]